MIQCTRGIDETGCRKNKKGNRRGAARGKKEQDWRAERGREDAGEKETEKLAKRCRTQGGVIGTAEGEGWCGRGTRFDRGTVSATEEEVLEKGKTIIMYKSGSNVIGDRRLLWFFFWFVMLVLLCSILFSFILFRCILI